MLWRYVTEFLEGDEEFKNIKEAAVGWIYGGGEVLSLKFKGY